MKQSLLGKLGNIEVLFVLLAFFNTWPIWCSDFFPTVDGPAHLYNSKVILELWNSNSFFQGFLEINPELVPNWTGHFLLAILQKLGFSIFTANKILLILIAFGIPIAFKNLLKNLGSPFTGVSFFSLILVYTFLFGMGFYNFGLGILMTLLSISLYLKSRNSPKTKIYVLLFLSIALCYFSHLVCFGLLCFYFLIDFVLGFFGKDKTSNFSSSLRIFLFCLPFVFLSALFFSGREAPDVNSYFGATTLWLLFSRLKIMVLYFGEIEIVLAQVVFYILMLYGLLSLTKISRLPKKFRIGLVLFGILMVLFFVMPDAGSNGSFISRRILIFAFWFLLIGLSPVFNFKWLNIGLVVLVVGIQSFRTSNYFIELKNQDEKVSQLLRISKLIEDESVVLDLYKGEGFKESHFASYLALDKQVLILDNYEANYGYFPIKWKEDFPKIILSNSNYVNDACVAWKNNSNSTESYLIDYVLVYGTQEKDPCELEFFSEIENFYQVIYPMDPAKEGSQILLLKRRI